MRNIILWIVCFFLIPSQATATVGGSMSASIALPTTMTPGTAYSATASLCVYNDGLYDDNYDVKITSTNGFMSNSFRLSASIDSTTYYLPYSVDFNDVDSDTGYSSVTYNSTLSPTQQSDTSSSLCTTNNARIRVNIAASALDTVLAGSYTDTLSVEISDPG